MKPGDLKSLVIAVLGEKGESSIHEVRKAVDSISNKKYAYTTIATVLTRLEKDGVVNSKKKIKDNGRVTNVYHLAQNAHKEEVESFLKGFISRFGQIGVKHLGEVLQTDLSDKEIEEIQKKLGM